MQAEGCHAGGVSARQGLLAEEVGVKDANMLALAGTPDGAGAGAITGEVLLAPLAPASMAQTSSSTIEGCEAMLLGWHARRQLKAEEQGCMSRTAMHEEGKQTV